MLPLFFFVSGVVVVFLIYYIFVYLLREIKKVSDFGEVKGEKGEEKRRGREQVLGFFSPLFLMDFMRFS